MKDLNNINLSELNGEINKGWKREFGDRYKSFFLDKGHVIGVKQISNRGDYENVTLRIASKYEIIIKDSYLRVFSLLCSEGW